MRLSNDQVRDLMIQAITQAGGSITHSALMDRLTEQGASAYAHLVLAFSGPGGPIVAHVKAQADGSAPVLSYKLAQ